MMDLKKAPPEGNVKERLAEYLKVKGISPDEQGMIHCLWHDDEKPSCKANKEFIYCFACGESGDIFKVAAALLDVPCDREHFRKICTDIETALGIPAAWKPLKRKPGEPRSIIKLSQSAIYRDLLLKEFAAALDNGDMKRAYYKATLLFALFLLPEGAAVPENWKERLELDKIASAFRNETGQAK
jgi:hypothetical protein